MTKQEIQEHAAWKYIGTLSPIQRYNMIFFNAKADIERKFNVTVKEAPFTYLSEAKENELCLSCQKDSNTMIMAVLTPNS